VPPSLFNSALPEQPVDVALVSSDVSLGLLEGLTASVREVGGLLRANLRVVGTSKDPHFTGTVGLADAGFVIASTGARYKNGNVALDLAADRISVSTFHLEDRNGQPLDVRGSLGTHELRIGDLRVDVRARHFEVLRNEFGTADVDVSLSVLGTSEAPRLSGDISVVGGQLNVDEILVRTLFHPYATQPIAPQVDAIAAFNPWDRLTVNVILHSQNALRLTGDNVVVSENAPLGLGSFDLRASGDLSFYKQPNQALTLTGSLDSISGSYSFQGRRFDVYPSSSVDFRGDLNPELFISVNRVISGVETRVTITGPLANPELRLSSSPPLDPSDVLSLIVFNTSANALSAEQQQELAVRAGTLAVGFLTSSLTTALTRSLGLDLFEIEPTTGAGAGARITVGEEIAPGLVARFIRQFGADVYDEATLEYYITRILRLRATFSDAGSLQLSPFRRVEKAGIDLLLFFSF
jgi:translocation and assembly module TamB